MVKLGCGHKISFLRICTRRSGILNGPTPISFCLFSFFSNTIYPEKTVVIQWGSNADRQRRRRARWPLDHHHGPPDAKLLNVLQWSITIVNFQSSTSLEYLIVIYNSRGLQDLPKKLCVSLRSGILNASKVAQEPKLPNSFYFEALFFRDRFLGNVLSLPFRCQNSKP